MSWEEEARRIGYDRMRELDAQRDREKQVQCERDAKSVIFSEIDKMIAEFRGAARAAGDQGWRGFRRPRGWDLRFGPYAGSSYLMVNEVTWRRVILNPYRVRHRGSGMNFTETLYERLSEIGRDHKGSWIGIDQTTATDLEDDRDKIRRLLTEYMLDKGIPLPRS